ncbi:uncharacterized protein LOC128676114 [Plodia interpunctella]|uniref:uncharacterized protein LOC128676114 n=1 Tax=Plodia interpunctella TaxID=58824 RepID=UPI002367EBC6|nr:uncharacterized protein LOC128676114 [Plodia interpunctella]XP_053612045.1 uncharacterized protein LOC128676114 [Plodia interpunctella]XP_053612053.1 uncharacterized protein LOC128676114 [Plodia interpunctella]XP_053612063.1 uncharacterized protein LOC128676114 [Plodia interpunctella]XP_053612072.1 uncharacterized protein LOC128676114 [Plodia interpunctella]
MAESQPECQLRRRRSSGNPNLPLNLDVGYQIDEGGPSQGTPSPNKGPPSTRRTSQALRDFKNKQQSFDIQIIQVEECEEEEIIIDSDDDGEDNAVATADRPVTPTPIQDFGANVVYVEGPQVSDFLQVKAIEHDAYTDVSDADSEEEEQ